MLQVKMYRRNMYLLINVCSKTILNSAKTDVLRIQEEKKKQMIHI